MATTRISLDIETSIDIMADLNKLAEIWWAKGEKAAGKGDPAIARSHLAEFHAVHDRRRALEKAVAVARRGE